MGKLKFVFKRILDLDYKRFFKTIDKIHKKTGKNRLMLFADIVYCGFRYQAGYVDYDLFQMYDLDADRRKSILTRGIDNEYIRKYNDPRFRHIFSNKPEFNARFKEFIKRDYLVIDGHNEAEFNDFIKGKEYIIVKPFSASHGDGVERITCKSADYQALASRGELLAEDYVIQDESMNKLNPSSINTIRAMSFYDIQKDEVFILAMYLRIGNGRIVDNFNGGGMVTKVDMTTHKCEFPAVDRNGILYEQHPSTGTSILGFEIPMYDEVVDLVKKAARVIPEVRFVGWDVGISVNGPCLIEGNDYPGHDICGMRELCKDGYGVLPEFEKYMPR